MGPDIDLERLSAGAPSAPPQQEPTLHGIVPKAGIINGEFYFGTAQFIRTLESLYARPGSGSAPGVPVWHEASFDRIFRLAAENLSDTIWKIDRVAELLDRARKDIQELENLTSAERMAQHQAALKDLPIHFESLIIYFRVLADCVAILTPYFYGNQRATIPPRRFRKQRTFFTSTNPELDPVYAGILKTHTKWFDVLAGEGQGGGHGLRDAIIHYSGGIQLMYRPPSAEKEIEITALLYSNSQSVWSLVPTLKGLVKDFCVFLDKFVVHFSTIAETRTGSKIFNPQDPNAVRLFQFEAELPSAWLFPAIQVR